nr:hypothetical protein GCM10020092_074440 [Actinoplanes digitatis]
MPDRQREDAPVPERASAAPARSTDGPDPVAAALLGLRLGGAQIPASVVARATLPNHLLAPLLSGRTPMTSPGDGVERAAREATGDGPAVGARLHTGDEAASVAALLQARAVTYGGDVYLGAGQSPSAGLLAHELAHVRQQVGGAPYFARDDLTQMSIGADYAHALGGDSLQSAIADLRGRLPGLTDPADRMAAEGNLAVLEQEAAADADFSRAYAPSVVELGPDALEASIGMSVAAPQSVAAGPIAAAGLVRDQLLADYVRQTRAMLLFRMDATAQFLDTVARQKLTNPQGAVSEETVAMLRTAAVEANRLGERVWISKRLVDSIEFLLANEPPPGSPAPQLARVQTIGSHQYISQFYAHGTMLSRGYPPELPDVLAALDRLGLPPTVTEDEVTASIREYLHPMDAWDLGMEVMERQGRVADWGPNVVGERYEWQGAKPSDDEIRAAGVAAAIADPQRREAERTILQSVHRPAPEDEIGVLDIGAVHPAYNYVALRFVLERFLADARVRLADDMGALDRHLDSVPPLRGYVSGWMVFLNEFLKGRGYRPIVDPDEVDANNVIAKLNEILAALASTRAKVADDDDYLYDSGIMPALAPIIDLYAQVDPKYGEWIRAVIKSNDRWREIVSVLLGAAALIGFGLAAVLTGGLAVGGLAVGVGATVGGAVRSRGRADELQAMALSGLGGFDAAAVANFVAWIDAASAVLTVAPVLIGGVRAAAGEMSVALRASRTVESTALVRAGPTGLVSLPRAAGRTLEWEFADVVFDPLTGEARVFAKHLSSGEIFHLRVNPATGDGTLTHVASGTTVPIAAWPSGAGAAAAHRRRPRPGLHERAHANPHAGAAAGAAPDGGRAGGRVHRHRADHPAAGRADPGVDQPGQPGVPPALVARVRHGPGGPAGDVRAGAGARAADDRDGHGGHRGHRHPVAGHLRRAARRPRAVPGVPAPHHRRRPGGPA